MIPCPLAIILYESSWLYAWNRAGGGPWLYRVVFAQRRPFLRWEQQWLYLFALLHYAWLTNPHRVIIPQGGTYIIEE